VIFDIQKKIVSGRISVKAPTRQIPETRAGLITAAFSGVDSPAEFFIFDIIYFAKSLAVPWILDTCGTSGGYNGSGTLMQYSDRPKYH